MRYFYDTEFIEDGRTIDLISIGIVAEDGREYYAVNKSALWDRIAQDEWLMENVVPMLPDRGSPEWKFHDEIRDEVSAFLGHGVRTKHDIPELWADYCAYDHVALAQLFGRMIKLPVHIPMWTNDLRQKWIAEGRPKLPEQDHEHDALADARWVKKCFDALTWNP